MPRPPKVRRMTVAEGDAVDIDQYPNFHKSGSITGMRSRFYGQDALLVRCGNYIYNVPPSVYSKAKG